MLRRKNETWKKDLEIKGKWSLYVHPNVSLRRWHWNKSVKPVRQQPGEIQGGEAEGSGQRPESHVVKMGKVGGGNSDRPAPSVLHWSHCTNSKRLPRCPVSPRTNPSQITGGEFLLDTTEQNPSLTDPLFIKIFFKVNCDSTDCYILLGKQFSKALRYFFFFFFFYFFCLGICALGISPEEIIWNAGEEKLYPMCSKLHCVPRPPSHKPPHWSPNTFRRWLHFDTSSLKI